VSGRTWIAAGALFGALAVATGAFGAHALRERFETSRQAEAYETAVRYQMYHALALVLVGLLALHTGGSICLDIAGACFAGGIIIFSGMLYGWSLGGPSLLGAIVPIGGTAFIIGWVALAVAALRMAQK